MPRSEMLFDVHGEPLLVTTQDPTIAAAVRETLGGFSPGRGETEPSLHIVLHSAASQAEVQLPLSPAAVTVRESREEGRLSCTLRRDGPLWLVDFGDMARLSLDLAAGRVEGWLVRPAEMPPDWTTSFVLVGAIELLRARGLYAIHAAGLEKEERGVIVVGASGSGKTTAALSLMRGGYGCLSDDHPLLHAGRQTTALVPFPGRIAVTERTTAMFPELNGARSAFRTDSRKRSFELDSVCGYRLGRPCRPALLIFPRIVDWPESSIERWSGARALEELLPQTLLVLEPALAERQFEVMSELVRKTPAYRLHFGEDVTGLPEMIDRLLEEQS